MAFLALTTKLPNFQDPDINSSMILRLKLENAALNQKYISTQYFQSQSSLKQNAPILTRNKKNQIKQSFLSRNVSKPQLVTLVPFLSYITPSSHIAFVRVQ